MLAAEPLGDPLAMPAIELQGRGEISESHGIRQTDMGATT